MAWFIPILGFAGRTILRRPVLSAAGVIIGWEFFTEADGKIGFWSIEEIQTGLDEAWNSGVEIVLTGGERVIEGIGEAIPEVIERLGPAVIKGINNTVQAIKAELSGREVAVITTGMVVILIFTTTIYITNWVRGAGIAAGNRGL